MKLFFDTSGLVKLVIDEPGSEWTRGLWQDFRQRFASRLAYVEMSAALAAAVRRHRLNAAQEIAARAAFADLWRELTIAEASESVVAVAAELARTYALRGYDAMQLGTAVAIRGAAQDVAMITWDDDLANVAVAEGINVVRTTES